MKKKVVLITLGLAVLGIGTAAVLYFNGIFCPTGLSANGYPVRGIDVSEYQGEIDWNVISEQNVDFAFIKATEGSSYVDEYFNYNFNSAQKTDLKIGVYHFFSYDSAGQSQAEHFINTVPVFEEMLPPVADVEFYGDYSNNPPDKEAVVNELTDFLTLLEEHYGIKPVIYATEKSYKMFIEGSFDEYDLWIRNVLRSPKSSHGDNWLFWQYSDKGTMDGYNGEEKFIDLNVFNGSYEELELFCKGELN